MCSAICSAIERLEIVNISASCYYKGRDLHSQTNNPQVVERSKGANRKTFLTARAADKFDLYQKAIQGSELIEFLVRRYRSIVGRSPRIFREDFCGTAFNCCEFVKLNEENHAIGVDIDESALRWCHTHNFPELTESQWSRITLIKGDVLAVMTRKVEFIAALNFSYGIFKTRSRMLSYFRNARKSLLKSGIIILDAHGGPTILEGDTYRKKSTEFTYVCEGSPVDPITNELTLKIHYRFPDGSQLRNAYQYNFRLWSLPELVELLQEAGFRNVHVLWEGTDWKTKTANGIFRRAASARTDSYPMWIAYVVAQA